MMDKMPTIDQTKNWVTELHKDQTDKAGKPYVGHVLRVYRDLCERFPDASLETRHAALLHDVVEDCDISFLDLKEKGYSDDTLSMVQAVTKNADDGLTYIERIENLAKDGPIGAIQIKICDLRDNSDPKRLANLPDEKAESLNKRYQKALLILTNRMASF